MIIKRIQLTPLGEFFFGGEQTFGKDNRHYFVRSRLFPQQTSLLGLLRHELLKAAPSNVFDGLTVVDRPKAGKLVGVHSFDGTINDAFGIIEAISPVFMMYGDTPYFVRSREFINKNPISLHFNQQPTRQNLLMDFTFPVGACLVKAEQKDGVEKYYDAKTPFDEQLISKDNKTIALKYDKDDAPKGVFIKFNKTGNQKNYEGATDDNAFFKQDFYNLQVGWSFSYFVAFNEEPNLAADNLVTFGAERRPFRMQVLENDKGMMFENNVFSNFAELYPDDLSDNTDMQKVLLLSDAHTEPSIYQNAKFAITCTISFRNLKTALKDPNKGWNPNTSKSNKKTLLQRSSVLFADDVSKISIVLNTPAAWKRIGHNYTKTILPKNT